MQDLTYRVVIRVLRVLFRVLGLRIEVAHAERLPATGPVVVAANHQSFLDFAVVGLPAVERGRLVRFLAKESVFRAPVAGALMRGMHHVPVDRRAGAAAAVRAHRALRAGEVVGVYPEATIGHAFALKDLEDLRLGAAHLAITTGAPLVPVAHWGLHRVLTVGGRWSLRRGRWVGVVVGEPLDPRPGESAAELTARLHHALGALVEDLLDHYPDRPTVPSRAWWWPAHRGGGAPAGAEAHRLDVLAVARADRVDADNVVAQAKSLTPGCTRR
ncbi:lysophospholipid acyltransferase family protein [Phycicoccus sonneratiae]|uniref:1-acyl-sn-glycerol-3-phosphate acyltransferase n=1 Tax=Phycicoccus sonneratiae TaxID=2807628 RepID=A0ABS2CIQ1_9MICO|nr:lysophospholipid acyltransferase family protein [Phycicoccus sonneraticus]MBM6399754.1 1-acyl-sn-glycerol-3-phosphate acyltransferase [Phycicoccus sonneraticus]